MKVIPKVPVRPITTTNARIESEDGKAKPKRTLSLAGRPQYVDEAITISPVARSAIWLTVLFLVVFNAALLGIFAIIYMQNETRESLLWLFRIYFLFSNGNAFLMSYMSGRLRIAKLTASRSLSSIHVDQSLNPSVSSAHLSAAVSRISVATNWLEKMWGRWQDAAGVRGAYFDLRLLAEEIFEIGTQTAAALSASQSISNVPLNIIYAVVIFLNSIASFVFRRVLQKEPHFVWGTLLPMWMYLPIVKIWLDRDNVLSYVESFANSTREVERVLIISWKLYALSVIPFAHSLLNLLEIHSILREITPKHLPIQPGEGFGDIKPVLLLRYPVGRVRAGIFMRLAHALLPIYGVAVLVMTLLAHGVFRSVPESNQFGCIHRVYPWFSTKEACLGRQINCSSLNIDGSAIELEQALELFDRSSLADLFLISCPKLAIPPRIQSFNRLMTIIIKDSTIVEWSEAAMLGGEFFHELRTIQLNGVHFLQDPIGLVGVEPISSSVEWIHLQDLDGSRLLSLVGDHWRGLLFFDCMACGLTSFPVVLYQMPRLTMLMMAANNFTSIPEDWIARSQISLQMLALDKNPLLTELPNSLWRQVATCSVFSASGTNLSVVPAWLADVAGPGFLLTAINTPVCKNLQNVPAAIQPLVTC